MADGACNDVHHQCWTGCQRNDSCLEPKPGQPYFAISCGRCGELVKSILAVDGASFTTWRDCGAELCVEMHRRTWDQGRVECTAVLADYLGQARGAPATERND